MPAARDVLRVLLAVLGGGLLVAGSLLGVTVVGEHGFPAGLALGLALLVVAAGGAALGAAALLSGRSLTSAQRAGLKLAGALAVAAFVLPALGVFVAPDLLYEWFGVRPSLAGILAWFYLSAVALGVAVVVGAWRVSELAYAAFVET